MKFGRGAVNVSEVFLVNVVKVLKGKGDWVEKFQLGQERVGIVVSVEVKVERILFFAE